VRAAGQALASRRPPARAFSLYHFLDPESSSLGGRRLARDSGSTERAAAPAAYAYSPIIETDRAREVAMRAGFAGPPCSGLPSRYSFNGFRDQFEVGTTARRRLPLRFILSLSSAEGWKVAKT